MNSFEINKIIAAIILTIVIVFGVNKLADVIYYVKAPEGNTYNIVTETKEISKGDTVKTGGDINISALLALGNIDHGKMVFKKCAACHSASKGGGNKIGPALWGVIGRKAGSISDYKYSKALSSYGKEWTWEEMNGFLIKPAKWIKGNKMGFAGLKKEEDRASVILYLNQNSDSPKELP